MAGSRSPSPAHARTGLPLAVQVILPLALLTALVAVAAAMLAGSAGRKAADDELDRRAAVVRRAWQASGSPTDRRELRVLGRRLGATLTIRRGDPSSHAGRTEGDLRVREFRARGRTLVIGVPSKAAADELAGGRTTGLVVAVAGLGGALLLGWLLLGAAAVMPLRRLAAALRGVASGQHGARLNPDGAAELRDAAAAFNTFAAKSAQLSQPGSDPVTGLPHAKAFREALAVEVKRAIREQSPLAVVVIDLDEFKRVNETHGKERGDELLHRVGESFRATLRATDILARLGGDEFGMLLPKANAQQAQMVIDRARAELAATGTDLAFSAGFALYPSDAGEPSQLLHAAESAARKASEAGGGQAQRFDPTTSAISRNEGERAEVEALFDEAGAVTPVFQPLVALATGQVSGYEALTRFRQPPKRFPDQWFLLAQRVGLGGKLEAFAIQKALETPGRPKGAYLSLNLSPSTLNDPDVQQVLPADLTGLVIEVTEHELASDEGQLKEDLGALRERGARIAVDDAGAGYAGLQQLMRVMPDLIKLDRSLVQNLDTDPAKQALVDAFVRFGRRTGAQVVAEGIETEEELRTLADLDVSYGQGYFLAKPAPPWAQISPWVAEKLLRRSLGGAAGVEDIAQLPEGSDQRLAAVCARVARVSSLSELEPLTGVIADELAADEVVVLLRSAFDGNLAAVTARPWLPSGGRLELNHFPELNSALKSGESAQFLLEHGSGTNTGLGEIAMLANSGYRSMLAVPVMSGGTPAGVMLALADADRPWGRTQTNRAFVVAYQLGPVLGALAQQPAASAGP